MTVTSGEVGPGNELFSSRHAAAAAMQHTSAGARPMAAPSGASGGGSGSGSTVSASDFLQLLVSELQNQDPTQPTDPNTYVQQLVGVNSLQQLIQINQTLSGASSSSSSSATTSPISSGTSSLAVNAARQAAAMQQLSLYGAS